MSNKKPASKITLGMLKGKSLNTSVPTIAVRFNATAEEVEELYQSADESSEQTDSEQTKPTGDVESSPLRYLPRLGKRSASTDTSLATTHDSSPTSDPWRFFAGIRGKITKNIEDTITEIKHRNQEADGSAKKLKESKDNLSDSEDISESSISKTCGAASTTDCVEMSTDEDSSSLEKDKKLEENYPQTELSINPSTSALRRRVRVITNSQDNLEVLETSISVGALGKLIELQTGVNPVESRQTLKESIEVESGVEAFEDTSFFNELSTEPDKDETEILPEELLATITQDITNLKLEEEGTAISVQEVRGKDIRKSFVCDTTPQSYFAPQGFVDLRGKDLYRKKWHANIYTFRRLLFAVCFLIIYIYGPIPVYVSGFIAGAVFSVTLISLYALFFGAHGSAMEFVDKPFPSLSEGVLTVPEIKEHLPINTYEGWMNELPDIYDPLTYHISQTQSVYARLQGNLLRISHTRAKIPKRAMWNEPKRKYTLTQHRIYNLLGAKIMLLPEELHKKRHWKKKYPICIVLNQDQFNFDRFDQVSTGSSTSRCTQMSSDTSNNKKRTQKKKKQKTVVQPQIFSKLNEDDKDFSLDISGPLFIDVLGPEELGTLGMKLDEDLLVDDDDTTSQIVQDDEVQEDDLYSIDDFNTFSPLESPKTKTHLYLFGRTGREKEDWFRCLTAATHKGHNVGEDVLDNKLQPDNISDTLVNARNSEAKYLQYMSHFIKASKQKDAPVQELEYFRAVNVLWLNAMIARVIYDWSCDAGVLNMVKAKIQKKLETIKVPYFIEQLNVHELSVGNIAPLIHSTSKPVLDQKGLWVDLDISYQGNIVLTLQTKLNLMKLKDPTTNSACDDNVVTSAPAKWQSSDIEDTAESSTDDGLVGISKVLDDRMPLGGSSTRNKRLMRMVDKIAESKFFQAATENRYIKKAMEEVSNTDLSLKVEIKGLVGTLVLNIPPPPSDRLWIGFRPTPKLNLSAYPMVGVRNMSFIRYFTNWIEKKLYKEFEKVMVIPNMEDISIPHMSSELPK